MDTLCVGGACLCEYSMHVPCFKYMGHNNLRWQSSLSMLETVFSWQTVHEAGWPLGFQELSRLHLISLVNTCCYRPVLQV